jgi:ComF family protein
MLTKSTCKHFAQPVVRALVDAIFPPTCRVCGSLFHPSSRKPEKASRSSVRPPRVRTAGDVFQDSFQDHFARLVCRPCRERFVGVQSPICPACGLMFAGRYGEDHLCGRCLQRQFTFGRARAVGVYEHALLQLIHQLKYRRRMELALPLSRLLAAGAQHFFGTGGFDMIVPVPMHPRKLRRRGFNPATMIARFWMKNASALWRHCQVDETVLFRKRETVSQTGLRRSQRWENVRGVFRISDGSEVRIKARSILIVDDVITTGATADACARALLAGGAERVDVLTLAQAP